VQLFAPQTFAKVAPTVGSKLCMNNLGGEAGRHFGAAASCSSVPAVMSESDGSALPSRPSSFDAIWIATWNIEFAPDYLLHDHEL